ncbi:MAG: hypothetical protein V2A71_01775 [Candidatus Eisenbacteria bacterium]
MSRFLRRSPSYRAGRTSLPSHRAGAVRRILFVAAAFSLAFLFAWENIYVDRLLSELQEKRQRVENLRAQVAEARSDMQKKMMFALSSTEVLEVGLKTPQLEQVVLLAEGSVSLGEEAYASAQISTVDQIQRRILEFFVATALARANNPDQP